MTNGAATADPIPDLPDGVNGFRRDAVMIPVGVRPSAMRAMDLNGDGFPDFVVSNEGPTDERFNGDVRVILSDGLGGYTTGLPLTDPDLKRPASLDLGDVNGDGITDLVVGDRGGEFVYRFFGTANGVFDPDADPFLASQPIGGDPFGVSSLKLGSINSDQDDLVDVVTGTVLLGGDQDGLISFLGNIGGGAFASPQTIDLEFSAARVDLADMDGDGFLDVVSTNLEGDGSVTIRRYLGMGIFESQEFLVSQSIDPQAFSITDVNLDGKPDLLWTSFPQIEGGPSALGLLLRFNLSEPGILDFECAPNGFCFENFVSNCTQAVTLAAGDVNLDGAPDVALAHVDTDNTLAILRNVDAADDFPLADTVELGVGVDARALAFADVDLDGDPDLVALVRPNDDTQNGFLAIFENFPIAPPPGQF